jgi:hypothetical protein
MSCDFLRQVWATQTQLASRLFETPALKYTNELETNSSLILNIIGLIKGLASQVYNRHAI